MATDVLKKFRREGDWWGQREDGSWVRWNQRRGDWEAYPLRPPGISDEELDRLPGMLGPSRDFLVTDILRVYGFLYCISVAAILGAGIGLWIFRAIGGWFSLDVTIPSLRELVLEAPPFILVWITFIGAAVVYLKRTPGRAWGLRMVLAAAVAAFASGFAHRLLEPQWVDLSMATLVKGWALLVLGGWIWRGLDVRRAE